MLNDKSLPIICILKNCAHYSLVNYLIILDIRS